MTRDTVKVATTAASRRIYARPHGHTFEHRFGQVNLTLGAIEWPMHSSGCSTREALSGI